MNDSKTKIKIVFIPFLLIAISSITGYNFLRWALDIKLHILHLKEDLINYWLPVGVSFLVVILGLRKRLRILNIKGKRDNGHFLYQIVASFAIAVPIIISQTFLETASFNLVSVDKVSSIDKNKKEKYFEIKKFFVDTLNTMSYATGRTSGKHNENLTYFLYLASPLQDNQSITETPKPFWYAIEYSHRISNNVSDDIKQSEYESFINNSIAEFRNYKFHTLTYFENIPYSDDRDGFIEAIKKHRPISDNQPLFILKPKTEPFAERTGSSLCWSFGSLGIGALIFLMMAAIPSINRNELKRQLENKPLRDDDLKFILQFLIPKGNHFVTAILIDFNIIVFLFMIFAGLNVISPTPKELLEWGGNRRYEVQTLGQYWRLFTATFLHSGLMHLIMNMFGLGMASSILEPVLKRNKLLIAYILTGLFASYTSISWHENTVSVGASGAIFGLYGLLIALLVTKVFSQGLSSVYWTLIVLYAGVCLLFGLAGGIDNSAHIGGLLSGFVIGLFLYSIDRRNLKINAS